MNYPEHHLVKNGPIASCQVCNSQNLHLVLDLGHQPPCVSMLTKKMLNEPEVTYPLRMWWCQDCSLAQIDYCVDGTLVYYPNYPYRSGITKELVDYMDGLSKLLVSRYKLQPGELVIDLGSNDGVLLKGFKQQGLKVLGVEPTNIAKIANEEGIETIQTFFDQKTASNIKQTHGQVSLITATNMFAHMAPLGEVICGIEALLKDDGIFMAEIHYLLDVIEGGQFDTIYHEHLRTYSLKSLIKLFSYYSFTIVDVERANRYGGNIRIYAQKGKGRPVNNSVADLLKLEEERGLHKLETYVAFANRVKRTKQEFMSFLANAKTEGKRVVGNSCPGRSSTLLNYYGVDSDWLPYIAEQPASLKLNQYLPGKHIIVLNNEILIKEQPDYVVLLAWHYAKPIMQQLKARGLTSDFVIPLPDFKIVKNHEG